MVPPTGCCWAKPIGCASRANTNWTRSRARTTAAAFAGAKTTWSGRGLVLPARIDPRDPVLAHGLACVVKYVRLVRRKLGLRNRFYVQLVCKGMPYRKPQHVLGTGVVGLDLGPSTIAVVAQQAALLQPFCPEVAPDAKVLRRLERKRDRERRDKNPANYDDKGRVKPGKKRWHVSKRQRTVQARRREVYRKLVWWRRASAVTATSPIECWRWVRPSSWNASPIGPGNGAMGARSSCVRRGCLSNGCLAWLQVLAGRSCRSIPGEPGYPKRAPVGT